MNKTLLDYVQDILSDMDSDEVNTIDETTESAQVAQIVRSTYDAMMSNRNWPHMRKALQLTPSGDGSLPTHMSVEANLKELTFVNYNEAKLGETRLRYKEIRYKETDDFLRYLNYRNNDQAQVDVILDPTGIELLIINNTAPTYYTSFNDKDLVFDSYDLNVDSTLQASKIQAQGYVFPEWQMTDAFIPDIPQEAEAALLEEAKSKAMFKLKQTQDVKAEQEAARQHRWLSRKAWAIKGGVRYENYGRKGRK